MTHGNSVINKSAQVLAILGRIRPLVARRLWLHGKLPVTPDCVFDALLVPDTLSKQRCG